MQHQDGTTSRRNALVTGAARGLGLAVAKRLALEMAGVTLVDVDEAALAAAAAEAGGAGATVATAVCDIRSREACDGAMQEAVERFGSVDVLVNCAGVYPRVPILDISVEEWRLDLDINVLGTYFMMAACVRHLKAAGRPGRIVNVASIDAFKPHPPNAHYAASKAAVVSLTRSFALEFAADGIVVNAVAPGAIATERAKASEWYEEHLAHTPTRTPIEPGEVAELVAWLARPGNRSVTGEVVIISGGQLIA